MAKQSTALATALWAAFNFLAGCAGVPRPNTDLCIINAPNGNRACHNMATDYDDNGNLIPGKPLIHRANARIEDLNKFLCVDSPSGTIDGQVALKAYITKLRQHLANCQNGQ